MKAWPSQGDARTFWNTFGVSLVGYFSPMTGFDVVKFDEQIIKAPDGVSTADHVLAVYGQDALNLIKRLL